MTRWAGGGWVRAGTVALAVDAVGVLPIFLTGALAVQLGAGLGLSPSSLGLVFAAYFGAAALLSTPLRNVPERMGVERSLRLGTAVYAVSLLAIAVLATSTALLCGFVALAGAGTGLTRTASGVLVARYAEPDRQGIAFGLKHSSIPVASLAAGLSVPALGLTVGWRWAYAVAAVLAVAVCALIPRSPGAPGRRRAVVGRPDLPRRLLLLVAVSFAFGGSAATALGAYTVSTAVAAGMAEASAGVLMAVGSAVGLASRLLVGHWSDRWAGDQLDLVGGLLAAGVVSFLLLGSSVPAVLWVAVPLAFATGWAWLGSYSLAVVRLSPAAPGAALGVAQTGAFLGAIAGPAILGVLAEQHSFRAVWVAAAALSVLALLAVAALRLLVRRAGRSAARSADGGHDEDAAGPVPRPPRPG